MYLSLPRQTIVIEILESVEPTPELVGLCRAIHDKGYTIALDDFVSSPRFEPLIELAQLIKVDFGKLRSRPEQERLIRFVRAARHRAVGRKGGDSRRVRAGAAPG